MTDAERQALDRVAEALRRRRLEAVAIFTLESLRPLSFVASQALMVLGPIIQSLVPVKDFDLFCQAMEDRRNLDYLLDRLSAPADDPDQPAPGTEVPDVR